MDSAPCDGYRASTGRDGMRCGARTSYLAIYRTGSGVQVERQAGVVACSGRRGRVGGTEARRNRGGYQDDDDSGTVRGLDRLQSKCDDDDRRLVFILRGAFLPPSYRKG